MQIKETGKYILTASIGCRIGCTSGHTLKAGTILDITQIDDRGHKVFSKELGDWHFWDLPVVKNEDAPQNTVDQNGHIAQQA